MLTYIKINGFKSFHNFEMEFTPLTVIAGVNASGKSNLFDALQLLASLAETDLKTAFRQQRGDPKELFTQFGEEEYVSEMEFIVESFITLVFEFTFFCSVISLPCMLYTLILLMTMEAELTHTISLFL